MDLAGDQCEFSSSQPSQPNTISYFDSPPIVKRNIPRLSKNLKLESLSLMRSSFLSANGESFTNNLEAAISLKTKFQDLYTAMEIIGQGSCGVVKKVLHKEEDKIYAAKIVRASTQDHFEQIKREYQILSKLEHPNIIKAKELLSEEALGNAQLILEYFPGKNLEELIIEKGQIEETKVRQIIEQVVSALKYIHEKGVVHRDLTATNILVNDETYEVKLIDFSTSRITKNEFMSPTDMKNSALRKKNNFLLTQTGTDTYKAPEIVLGAPYNHSVDMWALGVVTYFALVGYKPFYSKNLDKLYNKIAKATYKWRPEHTGHLSHESLLFVDACLKKLPFIRLSSKEAMYHPWTKDVRLNLDDKTKTETKFHFTSPPVRRQIKIVEFKTLKSFALDFNEY